jgi:hypothetical protein
MTLIWFKFINSIEEKKDANWAQNIENILVTFIICDYGVKNK